MLLADLPTFLCHLRRATPNNYIFFFILRVINVLLIVHDSRNLLLRTALALVGNKSDNSDINDKGSERYSDIDLY